jgi:anti-anti-sigma regulatory factor
MLRIQRTGKVQVVFRLSGRLDSETANELRQTLESEKEVCRLALDLKDLTLVNRDAVTFLERCEAGNIKLRNCPPYVREWITREREATKGQELITRNSQSQEGPP